MQTSEHGVPDFVLPKKSREHKNLVRMVKTQRKIKYRWLKLCLAIIAGTLMLILYVSGQGYIISLEKKVYEIKKQRLELDTHIDNLRVEDAELSKGERIRKIAQDCLGMNVPEEVPKKLF